MVLGASHELNIHRPIYFIKKTKSFSWARAAGGLASQVATCIPTVSHQSLRYVRDYIELSIRN
jgi:hypothetical protein